jgi:hypothetical protein
MYTAFCKSDCALGPLTPDASVRRLTDRGAAENVPTLPSVAAATEGPQVRGFAWLEAENVPSGTRSPQIGVPRHRQEVCDCRGSEKEFSKIDGTKLECL